MDSFFTSYDLAMDLAEQNTTIVGTIRRNKAALPKVFASIAESKKRGAKKSIFCFSGPCELVSYNTDSNRNVCLLTTAHATEEVHEESSKPVVVLDYNKCKGGVDTMDKMLRCFTCKRKCSRWPMLVFFNMLDVGALAAYRTMEVCHPTMRSNLKCRRKKFIKELAYDLARNHLKSRCKRSQKESVLTAMKLIHFNTGEDDSSGRRTLPTVQLNNPRRRCEVCKLSRDARKDTKTTCVCDLCKQPFCVHHLIRSCERCYMDANNVDEDSSGNDDDMPSTSTRQRQKRRRLSPM